jgi:hypothetical protein
MWPISIATERTRRVHRAKTNLSVNRVMDATLHGPLCLSNKRGLRPRPALDTLASRVLRWGVLGAVIILSLVGLYDVGVVSFVSPASAITTGWRWLSVVIDVERSRASMWALLVLAPSRKAYLSRAWRSWSRGSRRPCRSPSSKRAGISDRRCWVSIW